MFFLLSSISVYVRETTKAGKKNMKVFSILTCVTICLLSLTYGQTSWPQKWPSIGIKEHVNATQVETYKIELLAEKLYRMRNRNVCVKGKNWRFVDSRRFGLPKTAYKMVDLIVQQINRYIPQIFRFNVDFDKNKTHDECFVIVDFKLHSDMYAVGRTYPELDLIHIYNMKKLDQPENWYHCLFHELGHVLALKDDYLGENSVMNMYLGDKKQILYGRDVAAINYVFDHITMMLKERYGKNVLDKIEKRNLIVEEKRRNGKLKSKKSKRNKRYDNQYNLLDKSAMKQFITAINEAENRTKILDNDKINRTAMGPTKDDDKNIIVKMTVEPINSKDDDKKTIITTTNWTKKIKDINYNHKEGDVSHECKFESFDVDAFIKFLREKVACRVEDMYVNQIIDVIFSRMSILLNNDKNIINNFVKYYVHTNRANNVQPKKYFSLKINDETESDEIFKELSNFKFPTLDKPYDITNDKFEEEEGEEGEEEGGEEEYEADDDYDTADDDEINYEIDDGYNVKSENLNINFSNHKTNDKFIGTLDLKDDFEHQDFINAANKIKYNNINV